ncbi:MAG: hypothetical protein QXU32_09940 [Nitrososphaerales archaeon]
MTRQDRSFGIAIFIACIVGFVIYAWLLLVSEWKEIVLQITVLAAVAGILGVFAWIGFAMAMAKRDENIDKIQTESKLSESG